MSLNNTTPKEDAVKAECNCDCECLCKTKTTRIVNARLFRNGKIEEGDLWIANGKILDAQKAFFCKSTCHTLAADEVIDAQGLIVSAGFVDIQINGAFGYDFSDPNITLENVHSVARNLLATGCTSLCPTIITSHPETYKKLLAMLAPSQGSPTKGASILGVHTEGPFISKDRAGAHPPEYIQSPVNVEKSVLDCYGSIKNIKVLTIAPELEGSLDTIEYLTKNGITVSIGHTASHINTAIEATTRGATLITHLFNAMTPFHHRDPGVIGILGMPDDEAPYYSIIVDGIHSHQYAVRFAQKAHGCKCVLITDAMAAMGLPDGHYKLGKQNVVVANNKAVLEENADTLAGSIVTIDACVRNYRNFTGCSIEEALTNATLHPAQVIHMDDRKGNLLPNMDADFIFLDDSLNVKATFIAGELAWKNMDIKISHLN